MGQIEIAHLPDGGILVNVGAIEYDRVTKGFFDGIPDAGCAVIVEVVVIIAPVFGLGIPLKEIEQALFLILSQVQNLFVDIPLFADVVLFKGFIIHDSEPVIEVTSGKIEIEIGLVEVKDTVIVDEVEILGLILHAYGTVPKSTVKLPLMRAAGHNVDLSVL